MDEVYFAARQSNQMCQSKGTRFIYSVFCLRKKHEHSGANAKWKDQLQYFLPVQRIQRVYLEPLDDSPLPNCAIWDVVPTDGDKQLLSELRRPTAMALPRCVVSRYATAWAESLVGAMGGHQSCALLCRYRCRLLLAEIPHSSKTLSLKSGPTHCAPGLD